MRWEEIPSFHSKKARAVVSTDDRQNIALYPDLKAIKILGGKAKECIVTMHKSREAVVMHGLFIFCWGSNCKEWYSFA